MKKIKRPFDLARALTTTDPQVLASTLRARPDADALIGALGDVLAHVTDPAFAGAELLMARCALTLLALGHEPQVLQTLFGALEDLEQLHADIDTDVDADADFDAGTDEAYRQSVEVGILIGAVCAAIAPQLSGSARSAVLDKLDVLVPVDGGPVASTASLLLPLLVAFSKSVAPDERGWAVFERLRKHERAAWAAFVADYDKDRAIPLLQAALDAIPADFDFDSVDDLDLIDYVGEAAAALDDLGVARPHDLALLARAEGAMEPSET